MPIRRLLMFIPCFGLVLAAPSAPACAEIARRDIAIVNHAAAPIVEIYVSPSSEDSWGDNRLGTDIIAPGAVLRLAVVAGATCLADVRVVYGDGRVEERRPADLCRMPDVAFDASAATAPAKATLTASAVPQITFVNGERRAIVGLYLSSSASDDWGDNHLSRPLAPGGQVSLGIEDGCIADMRIVFDNRAAQERRRIDICRDPPLTVRPGWTSSDERAARASPPDAPPPNDAIPARRT